MNGFPVPGKRLFPYTLPDALNEMVIRTEYTVVSEYVNILFLYIEIHYVSEVRTMLFGEAYKKFWEELGESRTMVLSTSLHDVVTSRMMSLVVLDERFFFQTDRSFRKYEQIKANPHVALCADNIQIEGECREVGLPIGNPDFCRAYEKYFRSSFRRYSRLENERLFVVTPTFIERWCYVDGEPFVEMFEVEKKNYIWKRYDGE